MRAWPVCEPSFLSVFIRLASPEPAFVSLCVSLCVSLRVFLCVSRVSCVGCVAASQSLGNMEFMRKFSGANPAAANKAAEAADGASAAPAAAFGGEILKSGILRKQGGGVKTWKERYFTLTKDALAYYKAKEDKEPIDSIPVAKIRVCQREETDTRNPSRFPHYFSVDVGNRVYVIGSRDEPERNAWVDAINSLIKDVPKDLPSLPNKGDELRNSMDNIAAAVGATTISQARTEALTMECRA